MPPVRTLWLSLAVLLATPVLADWEGLLDLRAVSARASPSWLEAGMGKQRWDDRHDGLRLGQAVLVGRTELFDELSGAVVIDAADNRRHGIDLSEAWLAYKPMPSGPWRSRFKLGAFFPALSLEHDGPGWTTTRTLSASAINSWLGEEFRTLGLEYSLSRPGIFVGSPHDFGLTVALFKANDPAGTLLAWRGWAMGDRITGLSETLPLPPLPIYESLRQDARLDNFREMDGRYGYYAGLQYGYAGRLNLSALHYDNRADPTVVQGGQWAWRTRFDHLGLQYRPDADWELLGQVMRGDTNTGPRLVYLDFRAWYALLARRLGEDRLAVRYDHFMTRQDDRLPFDNNDENGHALTLSYSHALARDWQLMAEWLRVFSQRPARAQLGLPVRARDDSLSLALRWHF